MSRYDQIPFNRSDSFVARRAFTFNGRKYGASAPFDWRKTSCSERKLRNLYEGKFIMVAPVKKKAEPKAKPVNADTKVETKAVLKRSAKVETEPKTKKPAKVETVVKKPVKAVDVNEADKGDEAADIEAFVKSQE